MTDRTPRSDRMQRIAGLAHNTEKMAARALADAQHRVHEHYEQLTELQQYRDEYLARAPTDSAQGQQANSLDLLRNKRQFLDQLSRVIQQQAERAQQAETEYEKQRISWKREHARARSLDKVTQQHRDAERKASDRRELKEQDDRSQAQTRHPVG